MSTFQKIDIYPHDLPASPDILDFLSSYLPYSIPLLRRLQFRGERFSDTALLLTTFPAPIEPPVEIETRQPFAVGFFDRSDNPGIQAWLFSSLELPLQGSYESAETRFNKADVEIRQVTTMLARFAELSPRTADSGPAVCQLPDELTEGTGSSEADILMIGSMHQKLRDCLSVHPSQCLRDDLMGKGGPYVKYLISVASLRSKQYGRPDDQALPSDNLQYCVVEPSDFPLIMANNSHIRHPKVLNALPNCAVRDTTTGRLAAFAFLGADGSLRTLHVEPEWRARGLGGLVAKKLLLEKNSNFTRDERAGYDGTESGLSDWRENFDLAHGDVAASNTASVRLFHKLGATRAWEAFWVRLDLHRIIYNL